MTEYSEYQKDVIRRYYENRDQIDEERLSTLVTNLFLATSPRKTAQLWRRAEELMRRLNVPESRVRHVVQTGDPAILAAVVDDLLKGRIPRRRSDGTS